MQLVLSSRSARWNYQHIIDEIEAVYGQCSEYTAAISIELRQRVRGPGEALYSLRDDIYEKVYILYADSSEPEQDAIVVEIFTITLSDEKLVQKLLEESPHILAKSYKIAHCYETTRRGGRTVK